MVSKANIEILQILTNTCGNVIRIIPFEFQGFGRVSSCSNSFVQKQYIRFWQGVMFTSLLISVLEIWWNLRDFEKNISGLVFHVILMCMKIASTSYHITFQLNTQGIMVILHSILTDSFKSNRNHLRKSEKLDTILLFVAITIILSLNIGIPVTSQLYYGTFHPLHIVVFGRVIAQSYLWRMTVFFVEVMQMIPCAFIGSLTALVTLNILEHSQYMLLNLLKVVKESYRRDHLLKVGMHFRTIQIFVQINNQVLEMYVWAVIQFIGGGSLISVLYGLIVLHEQFSFWVDTGLLLLGCMSFTYVGLVFHFGMKPMKYSKQILEETMHFKESCKRTGKFFQSCPVIAIRVGGFHKLDRKRGPDFFRFIFQRTAFLVANTKHE